MEQSVPNNPEENGATPPNQVPPCVQIVPVGGERYNCNWENCNEIFNTLLELDNHASAAHATKDPPYICRWKTCRRRGNPFEHFFSFVNHMRTHIAKATHPCPVPCCTRRYRTLESLRNHMVTHTAPKPYSCSIAGCFRTFTTTADRAKHISRAHSNVKRFLCPMLDCTRRYSDPSSLRKHLKGLHGESAYLVFRELKSSVRVWEKSFRIRNDVNGIAHIVGVNGEVINFEEIVNHVVEMTDAELQHHQNFGDLEEDGELSDDSADASYAYPKVRRYSAPPFHPHPFYPPMSPFWPYSQTGVTADMKSMVLPPPHVMGQMIPAENAGVGQPQANQSVDGTDVSGPSSPQPGSSNQPLFMMPPFIGPFPRFYNMFNQSAPASQGISQSTPENPQGFNQSTPPQNVHQGPNHSTSNTTQNVSQPAPTSIRQGMSQSAPQNIRPGINQPQNVRQGFRQCTPNGSQGKIMKFYMMKDICYFGSSYTAVPDEDCSRIRLKNGKQKRKDIQYLRGVAIAAVLGFHLRPELVPQGFLGVDMFFVISGYLMTLILKPGLKKSLTAKSVLGFYERRTKRLFPVYFLVVFTTLLVCGFFLIALDFDFLRTDALWAVLFSTNLQSMLEKKTYFSLVSDYKFLLHTWSLSVELQYYLLAPFLIYGIYRSGHPLVTTTIVGFVSLVFQVLMKDFEAIAFGCVFSRVWQFLVGSLVFCLEERRKSTRILPEDRVKLMEESEPQALHSHKSSTNLRLMRIPVVVSLFAIAFMPALSPTLYYTVLVRIVATILTGIAVFVGWDHESNQVSRVFVYFGDISYSVYLVHWPVVLLFKYLQISESWSVIHDLGIIFALSILQYELFERKLLKASSQKVLLVCTGLVIGIVAIETQQQGLGLTSSTPQHPSVAANQVIASNCNTVGSFIQCNWDQEMLAMVNNRKPTKTAAYFCSYDGPGKATVFFTGNSFALRQLAGIKESLKGRYKKLYFAARPACLTFESFNEGYKKYWQCDEIKNKTLQFLEKFRPDFLVISEKLSGNAKFQTPLTIEEARSDGTAAIVADYLKQFSPFVKKIFIVEPHPTVSYNPATRLAKQISQGKSVSSYFIPTKAVEAEVDPGWLRMLGAMETCPKCEPILIRSAFCEDDRCPVYEGKTMLSLFCDNSHLSPHGVEKLIPVLKAHFNKALADLKLN